MDIILLLVSDTAHNRRVLAGHREDLRALLPLDGREVLRALAAGRLPPDNGLLVI